jgi:hypothetical protein
VTVETPIVSTVHHPLGTHGLFGVEGLQLPAYVQNVARAMARPRAWESLSSVERSHYIHMALGIVENWKNGHDGKGHPVSPEVQAAAASAWAEWEAAKARAHAIPNKGEARHFVASREGGERGMSTTMRFDAWGRQIELAMPPQLAAVVAKKGAPPNASGPPNAAKRQRALSAGHALPPAAGKPKGEARFPIENERDLTKAFGMVQLAKGPKEPIRRFIMAAARRLGYASRIPPNWNPDGTLKAAKAA